jgi:hypothetical protein
MLVLLIAEIAIAQSGNFTVRDKESGVPVPLATIKVLHTTKGAVSNDLGYFQINIENTDTMLVSCIGYQSKKVFGADVDAVIFLDRQVNLLDTVIMRETVPVRTLVLGNGASFLNQNLKCRFPNSGKDSMDCFPWAPSNMKEEWAERMELPHRAMVYKINKIYVPTKKGPGSYGELWIRVYATDEGSGLPGEELYSKIVKVNARDIRKNKVVLDVSKENWSLNNTKSFFVSIGWPPRGAYSKGFTPISSFVIYRENSFHRHLNAIHYLWMPWSYMGVSGVKVSTLFAVELEERKVRE